MCQVKQQTIQKDVKKFIEQTFTWSSLLEAANFIVLKLAAYFAAGLCGVAEKNINHTQDLYFDSNELSVVAIATLASNIFHSAMVSVIDM